MLDPNFLYFGIENSNLPSFGTILELRTTLAPLSDLRHTGQEQTCLPSASPRETMIVLVPFASNLTARSCLSKNFAPISGRYIVITPFPELQYHITLLSFQCKLLYIITVVFLMFSSTLYYV